MKKNNDGYVLVHILLAVVVLSLLSLLVSAATLRNLRTQERAVEQMQQRYMAEGINEQFAAALDALSDSGAGRVSDAKDAFPNVVGELEVATGVSVLQLPQYQSDWVPGADGRWQCDMKIQSSSEGAVVTAELQVTVFIEENATPDPEEPENPELITYTYDLSVEKIDYLSYEVSARQNEEGVS